MDWLKALLEFSSIIENAPYVLNADMKIAYAGNSNSGCGSNSADPVPGGSASNNVSSHMSYFDKTEIRSMSYAAFEGFGMKLR